MKIRKIHNLHQTVSYNTNRKSGIIAWVSTTCGLFNDEVENLQISSKREEATCKGCLKKLEELDEKNNYKKRR